MLNRGQALEDFSMPTKFFKVLGGYSESILRDFRQSHPEVNNQDDTTNRTINVFAFIKAQYHELRRTVQGNTKTSHTYTALEEEDALKNVALDLELKHEKTMEKRITNQIKLGKLILKEEASDRVIASAKAIKNHIFMGIKTYAADKKDPRTVEQELTKAYNRALEELERISTIIPWEADGSAELLRTRLVEMDKVDNNER